MRSFLTASMECAAGLCNEPTDAEDCLPSSYGYLGRGCACDTLERLRQNALHYFFTTQTVITSFSSSRYWYRKESVSKFLIGNRFHVKLHIL